MKYIDQHMHTDSSVDSVAPMSQMAQAAYDSGLDAICFTDHCDLIYYNRAGVPDEECYNLWSRSRDEFEKLGRFGDMKIRIGMELGEINQDPERAKVFYETKGLDFILGSVHAIRGQTDFCLIEYTSMEQCHKLVEQYLDENIETAKLGYFDSLAHVGYTIRYMKPCGMDVDLFLYEDRLRELFRVIIEKGKALEINTSGLRQGVGTTFPTADMMRLYRQCGGELVTIGSDAHRPQDVGSNYSEAVEILTGAGFEYFAVYEGHKPMLEKL